MCRAPVQRRMAVPAGRAASRFANRVQLRAAAAETETKTEKKSKKGECGVEQVRRVGELGQNSKIADHTNPRPMARRGGRVAVRGRPRGGAQHIPGTIEGLGLRGRQ